MSPTGDLLLAGILMGLAILLAVASVAAVEDRIGRKFVVILACVVLAFTLPSILELHAYATGRAKYELRDNPDGTRTWQRVEVKQP